MCELNRVTFLNKLIDDIFYILCRIGCVKNKIKNRHILLVCFIKKFMITTTTNCDISYILFIRQMKSSMLTVSLGF